MSMCLPCASLNQQRSSMGGYDGSPRYNIQGDDKFFLLARKWGVSGHSARTYARSRWFRSIQEGDARGVGPSLS